MKKDFWADGLHAVGGATTLAYFRQKGIVLIGVLSMAVEAYGAEAET